MMKKLMLILERLVQELQLNMVLWRDTHMLGPGRLSGDNHDHEDINWEGTWFSRTNQYEEKHDT